MKQDFSALGLMSGTSLDGIDAAILRTDGVRHIAPGADAFNAYDGTTRTALRAALQLAAEMPTRVLADIALWPDELVAADALVTQLHIEAASEFITTHGAVDVIGLHGQTIIHRPQDAFTLQIGDEQALAKATGVDVVAQFRQADMAAGGQGAPLAPLYHAALWDGAYPAAVLNLGGIANISWLGVDNAILAFDCGPANALIDDWIQSQTGQAYDKDGALAAQGQVNEAALVALMDNAYFAAAPPKSLDRLAFDKQPVEGLSRADGAATLTAFSAKTVAAGLAMCPQYPKALILCGGGRHNKTLVAMLADYCAVTPIDCDALGWRGDALEAQLFGWLAVRSIKGLALSTPQTTGVSRPITGGLLYRA